MPSQADVAKRELVKVLRELAAKYRVPLSLCRESSKQEVDKAFRKVSCKAHPDKGGLLADFQKLSATNDVWQDLLMNAGSRGRPAQAQQKPRTKPKAGDAWTLGVPEEKKEFSVRSQATA